MPYRSSDSANLARQASRNYLGAMITLSISTIGWLIIAAIACGFAGFMFLLVCLIHVGTAGEYHDPTDWPMEDEQ